MVHVMWKDAERKEGSDEEWTDVGGLFATQGHGEGQARVPVPL